MSVHAPWRAFRKPGGLATTPSPVDDAWMGLPVARTSRASGATGVEIDRFTHLSVE